MKVRRPIKQPTPPPPTRQPMTIEFKHVQLRDLYVPVDVYQRPTSAAWVKSIVAEGWDEGLQSVLMVSAATNHVIDGAHRVAAAHELGITSLPALVYHGLTIEQEARYFARFNEARRRVGLKDSQRAKLAFKEPEAVAAQEVVDAIRPKRIPLQTVKAANARYPGELKNLIPVLKELDTPEFPRDFVQGLLHYAHAHGGLNDEVKARLKEPRVFSRIQISIKGAMREHMRSRDKASIPADWSVKAEGFQTALNYQPTLVLRDKLI